MEGTLGPEEARSRKFEMVRRGYDKRQVDRFRDEAAVSIAALATELQDLREKLGQAGMVEVPDLKVELDAVGSQVAEILEAARTAAEGMRSRASEDAARWRAEADKEARALRSGSNKDAEQARGSAWEEGTQVLKQADIETKKVLEEARQETLFIRAEAEREALRLTGDARRDKEEAVRKSRADADRLLLEARAESGRILEEARESAQNAQERAQALEQRRTELMDELAAARLSIGQMEQEIDTRREALQVAADNPEAGVRVIKAPAEPLGEWVNVDASVRIVPASQVAKDEPVDPDAFVAEVEQLQSAIAATEHQAEKESVEETPEEPPESLPTESADPVPATSGLRDESEPTHDSDLEEPAVPDVPASAPPEPEPEPVVSAPEPAPAVLEIVEEPVSAVPAAIGDLFTQLRTDDDGAAPEPSTQTLESATESAVVEAAPARLDDGGPENEEDQPTAPATARELSEEPFELRDRVLLPIENRTLRSVKRRIVDLQNRVLEELRLGDETWDPDRSMFVAALSDDIARMNQESFVAGYASAAELVGEAATPPPDRAAAQVTSGDFVDSLIGGVTEALERARSSGGGSRRISAAVGRVFRAWRTDEAERRLRHASYLAYNEGLAGAYPELGIVRVMAAAPGNPCGDCPAGTGSSWEPGGALPPGTAFPPAGPKCRATIVPSW